MARSAWRSSPLVLLIGLLAVVALLAWGEGWALPVVIGLVVLMIILHEFGHYVTARLAGLRVTDFFVGFGPVVWSTTRRGTRYGIRALPLGGYVKVPGMTWDQPLDEGVDEAETYRAASYPRKVLFASAGSITHVLMALVLLWAAFFFVGQVSSTHVGVAGFSTWDGYSETPAKRAGLHVGDQLVSIDGHAITSESQLVGLIHDATGRRLTIVVDRAGRDLTLHATPVDGRTVTENGQPVATGSRPDGFLGFEVEDMVVKSSFFGAIGNSVVQVGDAFAATYHGIVHVFSPSEFSSLFHQVASSKAASNPTNQATRPVSVVGVVRLATEAAQSGVGELLFVLAVVNIFVGVMNMIPMLPLDGGYVAIATYERIRSRRERRYRADVNRLAPVVYAFCAVLFVLFACTLYLDIAHPIANPFG